ncbi:MAG: hypothetical protein JNK63_00805 [Chthonomonas sp.]|nr:hypothetical protein [Chthonomonas sp.]
MTNKLPIWVWPCVLLAAIASLYSVALRHKVEAGNRAVAPALEWGVITAAASTSGIPSDQALAELIEVGLRAVILPEDTIGDAIDRGEMTLTTSPDTGIKFLSGGQAEPRVRRALTRRGVIFPADAGRGIQLSSDTPMDTLKSVSLGLDAFAAKQITEAGLALIARNSNTVSPTKAYVEAIVADAAGLGAFGFLPQGDSVLGSRAHLQDLVNALKAKGMVYCSPEFAKMSGEAKMTALDPRNVVRLHAIQAAEIGAMTPGEVVERYGRAAGERNQRILLVRPFDDTQETPLKSLLASINKVSNAIRKEGLAVREPHPWEDPTGAEKAVPVIALAVLGIGMAMLLTTVTSKPLLLAGAVALVAVAGLAIVKNDSTYLATLAAVLLPVLGYMALRQWSGFHPIIQFGLVSIVSIVGGLCVAGLLNGPAFYVRADTFWAVKVAHFLPILIVGAMVIRDHFELPKLVSSPVTWGSIIVGLVVLIGLGFMLARTGNDNPAAVSGIELKIRSLLERYLSVRPRTKEFILGHPALIIGLFALARPNKRSQSIGGLLVALGMIGQTSMVNTMCHLHTPVMVGLIRITIGLVAGLIVGLALWPLVRRWLPA